MPDPKKNILESIFPKDFQQKESSLFQQASGGKFVDHSDFSEASKGDMNSFLISSRKKLEEKKRKAQEEERKQREAQVSEASNEIGNVLSQMQEYESSLEKDEKGNTVLTKEDEQALLELAEVADGLYKNFPEVAEQHKKKIKEVEEKFELTKKVIKDKLPINPYLSIELGENVENKISNLRNTLNAVQSSQPNEDVAGNWLIDKALGVAEGIIGTASNTSKQLLDHYTMSSALSEEELEEYNSAKESLAKLQAPVAYARSKQSSLLIQELEKYMKSEESSYSGDTDRVNVLLHKLKRSKKYQDDIYKGNTSLSLDVAVRELIGRNIVSLNSNRSEFTLLPGMQEELLDMVTGTSNIEDKWEEKTLEYANETGKKLEDFTPEDFESVKNSMSKLDQLNLRTMILTSADHEVEEFVSLGYKTMMGTAHSIGMMGGFMAGNYGTALLKSSRRQFLNGYKGVTKATTKARKMADQVSKTPSLKGVITSTGEGFMGTVIGGAVQPMFINEELRNESDWGWVKDNEGKFTGIAAGTAFKEHKVNQLKEEKQYYKELIEKAEEYGVNNLSEDEKEQYLHALALLGQGEYEDEEGREIQSLDKQIELLKKTPDSKFKSYLKGYAMFGVEKVAEFSTGKGLSALGKGASKLGESVVGKTNAKLIREKANNLTNNAKRGYYSSYIGSKHRQFENLSQNFVKPGGEKMINSLGTEIVEEYVAELGQALVDMSFDGFEDGLGPLNEAFHTMATWDFNRDVALQTLTMKAFFGLAGGAKRGSLLGYSKVYENKMNSRLEKLEDLKKQLNNPDLSPQEKAKLTKQYNKISKLTTDSQKNRTISGKSYLSSVGEAATETKMELERNKAQEKLIQQLEARGELDAETKDLLRGMDMTAESISEKQRRIAMLYSKGKYKEAAMLEQNMMSNLIENSIHYENVGAIKKALHSALTDSSKSKDMQTARNMQSLLRTTEKLEKHFNENGYSPRTKIAGKVILQQGLIQNSIDNSQESLRLSSEEARKDLIENPGTIDLGSLSKDEALMALSEDLSNPFEEGTEKYEDFENLQIGLVEYAQTNNSDLAKHIKTRENLNRAKQSLENSRKRFSEAMNPGMQTLISESALKDIVPALNEEIKGKDRLLTKEELELFLDKNDKLISQDADTVTKQKIKTRIRELHNATKALQEKYNKEDSQRLAQAKKEETEDAPKEDEGEVTDTSQESRESRKVVENIESRLAEETNLGEPDVDIFQDDKNDEELSNAETDPSQETVGEKAYSIDLNEGETKDTKTVEQVEADRKAEIDKALEVEGKGLVISSKTTGKGVEKIEKRGTLYKQGDKVTAEFAPTPKGYKEGNVKVIVKQRKPEIHTDGVMTQTAEIIVMDFASLEEGKRYIAENPIKANPKRIDKINAKYDAELRALEKAETPKENLDDIFKGLEGDMSIDTSSMGEIPLDQNLVDQVKEEVYSMIDILQSVGKTEVTFTDVINELLSYESVPGLLTQGKGFRYLIRAWEAVHNEKGKGEAFKKGEIQAMRDQMQSLSRSSQSIEEALEKRKDEAIKHSTVNTKLLPDGNNDKIGKENASIEQTSKSIEEKNNPPKREEKGEKGKTVVTNTEGKKGMPPRLGYLGLSYERVEDERGGVTTKTTDFEKTQREKSEGGKWIVVDPRLLSHPDNTQTLDLDVEIAKEEDWDKVMMTEGEADRLNKKPVVISFKEWIEKREATNPDFRNTEEFYASVPIFVNRGGKRAAYVHTQDWFNGFTVPSPTKNIPGTPEYIHPSDYKSDPSWESAVEQAKQRNAEVRKAILLGKNPPTKLTVNRKGESVAAKINDDMPAMPVSEANPQAQLFVMTSNDMKSMVFNDLAFEKGKDKGFKEGSKILLNDPSEFSYPDGGAKKGHVFALYKVDSIKNEDGKVVERYRAFPLQRKINTPEGAKVFTEQMNSVLHAFAIHEILNGNKVSNPEFDISLEDARKFNTDLARTSNMDLSSVNGFTKYFNQFLKLGPSSVKELNEKGLNRLIKKNINSGLSKEEAKKKAQEEYNTNKGRDYLGFKLELIDLMNIPANKRFNHFSKRVVQNTQAYLLNNETKPVSYINNLGVQSTGKTYHEYLKDNLTTVFKAFNMAQEGEKDAYTASVQPVWEIQDNFENMEYEEVGHSTFKQKQKQEVKTLEQELFGEEDVSSTEGLSEQQKAEIENFISEYLNTNLDFFIEISNRQSELETVIDAVALAKKFNGEVAGLPQHMALPFINLIANTVVRKAEFRSSLSKDSMDQIKAIARRRIGLHTSKVIKEIQSRIDILEEAYKDSNELSAEQESLLTALDYNLELMEKIKKEETFDLLFDQAKLKVSQLAGVKEMDSKEAQGLSEEQANEKNYSKDSVEETVKSKATGKIKMLLSSIPIYDKNGDIVYDYAGIPAYMSLDDVYNLVLKTLSIGIDPKGNYDYMISKLKESSHPAIQEVIKRLENSDGQLKNQFVVNSARHSIQSKFTMYEVNPVTGETNLKVYDTNSGTIVKSVINNWKNNTTNSDLYNFDGSLNVAFATEIRKTMRELPANMESFDFVAVKDIFTKIGLELHPKTWEDLEKRGMASGTKTYSLEGMWRDYKNNSKDFSIFSSIDEALKQAIENPSEHSAQGKTLYDNNVGAINGIAKIEAENNPELVSLVYRDSGKTISTLTPPKLVTDEISKILHSLNEDGEYVDQIKSISFSSNSMILQYLEDSVEFREFFGISHKSLTSLKDRNKSSNKEKKTNSLDTPEFLLDALGAFQDRKIAKMKSIEEQGVATRLAHMFFPTMSDKDTSLVLNTVVLDLLNSENNFVVEGDNVSVSDIVLNIMFDRMVQNQIEKIVKFHQNKGKTNIKSYDSAAGLFVNLPGLNALQIEGQNLVSYLEALSSKDMDIDIEAIRDVVLPYLKGLVESELNTKFETVKKFGLTQSNVKGEKKTINRMIDSTYVKESGLKEKDTTKDEVIKKALLDFVVNDLITQSEIQKLFVSDPALYFKHKFPKDKNIYNLSTQDYINMSKDTGVNLGKRLALLIAPGEKSAKTDQKYKQIFLKDPVDISQNIGQLIDWFYPEKSDKLKKLVTDFSKKVAGTQEYGNALSKLEKEMPIIAGFLELESADAQEYTTVAEHLNVMYIYGKITEEQYNKLLNAYEKGGLKNLSKEDQRIVMQPMKPVHTGIYNDVEQDVRRVVYIKSSSIPLFPEFTKNSQLDNLRVAMEELEKNSVDEKGNKMHVRASYQTANKVGALKETVDIYNQESIGKINLENSGVSLTLDRNNFRIQQEVPHKSSKKGVDKVSMGTQIFKLLFGDGILDTKGEVFPYKGKKVSAKELKKEFDRSFNEIYDISKTNLYEELGLDKEGNVESSYTFRIALSELLKKEALERGYDIRSTEGLNLVSEQGEAKFVVPLWLSSDANRMEALLNSILTNRLMQMKLPGNGFVAASESGIQQKEFDQISPEDRNNIIYLEGWDGKELKATRDKNGEIQSAQVMVESKFKNAEGELIDLFEDFNGEEGKYIKTNDNGSLGLKTEMFDKEILNMFTFRTPTSGHVSASSVEVVGILPPQSGDVMIVPKNFTKQKGLDFDVDKESAYILNHYIDSEGRVRVYDDNFSKELDKLLEEEVTPNGYIYSSLFEEFNITYLLANNDPRFNGLSSKLNRNKVYKLAKLLDWQNNSNKKYTQFENVVSSLFDVTSSENSITLTEQINELKEELYKKESSETVDKVVKKLLNSFSSSEINSFDNKVNKLLLAKVRNQAKNKLKKKMAENDFIRTHLSVFNTSDVEVQKKINRILSMDFAQSQAEQIEELTNEGIKNVELQKIEEEFKAKGKNLSNKELNTIYNERNSYFNLLSHDYQKSKSDLGAIGKQAIGIYSVAVTFNSLVQQAYGSEGMEMGEFTIGNISSNSLGGRMASGENYTTAEALQEKQNTATDNEKEQILGRVGVDAITITADSHGTLRGFGKDENGNSVLYNLLSQPIVKEYSKRLKESKGMLGEYVEIKDLVNELMQEIGSEYKLVEDPISEKLYFVQRDQEVIEQGSKILTGDVLLDGITKGSILNKHQDEALRAFIQLDIEGKKFVSKISSLNNNTLGKSIIGVEVMKERLENTLKDSSMIPLFGKRVDYGTPDSFPVIKKTPFGVEVYGVLPTTPQGKIAIDGLLTHEKLFKDLFPYKNQGLKNILDSILLSKGIETDMARAEDYESIIVEMRKYIFSSNAISVHNSDANNLRKHLMTEGKNKPSLAKYIKDVLDADDKNSEFSRGIKVLKNNPLIGKKLKYIISKDSETGASTIEYNNANSEHIDDSILYSALPQLVQENALLPNKDGEPYDTKMLVEDLVRYSFLQGGVQEATEFIKYVPIELLSSMYQGETSISKSLRGLHSEILDSVHAMEELLENFPKQYFQNNPSEARFLGKAKKEGDFRLVEGRFQNAFFRQGKGDKTVLYETEGGIVQKDGKTYSRLKQIPITKVSKISQYNPQGVSVNIKGENSKGTIYSQFNSGIKTYSKIGQLLTDARKSTNPGIKAITEIVAQRVDLETPLKGFTQDPRKGISSSNGIYLNMDVFNANNQEEMFATALHEVFHQIMGEDFKNYYHINNQGQYTLREKSLDGSPIPSAILNANVVFTDAVAGINNLMETEYGMSADKISELRSIFSSIVESSKTSNPELFKASNSRLRTILQNYGPQQSQEIITLIYGTINPNEMFAHLIETPIIREALNKIPYRNTNKSLFQKIIEAFKDVVKTIFPQVEKGSLAEAGLSSMIELLESKQIINELETLETKVEETPTGPRNVETSTVDLIKQEKSTKQEKDIPSIKEGVSELFKTNPELANSVYKAMGFEQEGNLPTSNETINIYAGSNQNAELSNFAIRPFTTNVETPSGEKQYTFQSVEQGFHFYKALVANNAQIAKQILATTNGGELRRLTNRSNLKMTSEQVKEWDDTSKSIMLNLMYDSYEQNPKAAEKLLATGDAKITHTQDNTRWKTDFPEVVMTVRDMLKEEGFGNNQITQQQKQEAQQAYSNYVNATGKQDIQGFKDFVDTGDASFNIPLLASTQDSKVEFDLNSVKVLADLSKPVNKKAQRKGYRESVPQALTLRRGKEAYWKKQLAKKGVDKVQIDLIFNYLEDNNIEEISTEELAMEIASKYSFAVEINTATTRDISYDNSYLDEFGNYIDDKRLEELQKENPTQHYSNLTVPGGTNYTENEISTPLITPYLKGHAQFSTENGIGWFRSDEQASSKGLTPAQIANIPEEYKQESLNGSKTRRVLEVQSDLFQKGRDKENLVTGNNESFEEKEFRYNNGSLNIQLRSVKKGGDLALEIKRNEMWEPFKKSTLRRYEIEEFKEFVAKEVNLVKKDSSQNQFLQLLNKDNNWVSFFIKSIIQDSAKKGYEKVLFPSGDTASKVEGHTTLQEFKKQKEDRINKLEKDKQKRFDEIPYVNDELIRTTQKLIDKNIGNKEENIEKLNEYKKQKEAGVDVSDLDNEINQLKQELARVEGPEGFAALKPIWNFYENTVNNSLRKIVDKKYLSDITDEYGNSWTEIDIEALLLDKMMNAKRQDFALLDGINEISDPTLENSVNFAITDSGQTVADLGIPQSEWDTLSALEKNNFKKCN